MNHSITILIVLFAAVCIVIPPIYIGMYVIGRLILGKISYNTEEIFRDYIIQLHKFYSIMPVLIIFIIILILMLYWVDKYG